MAHILSLETSSKVCSVAIHNQSNLLAAAEVHIDQSHGSKLAILIEDVIKFSGIDRLQLRAVAVSSGPGSFTGLRIGVATAKGLCYSLGVPLIAINTLDLLAAQVRNLGSTDRLLCPMIDARRMEVYCKVLDAELNELIPTAPLEVTEDSFTELLQNHQMLFFGDGAMKCKTVIASSNSFFLEGIYPSASHLGVLASEKFINNHHEDVVNFEPFYLKEFAVKSPRKEITR